MTDEKIKAMIMELLEDVDYDIAKNYNPETAEDPSFADDEMDALVLVVKKYLSKQKA